MRFNTSTYFIKEQLPGITKQRLLSLYERELIDQGSKDIAIVGNKVVFSNNFIAGFLNNRHNKFAGFKNGQIEITEDDSLYNVILQADVSIFAWVTANITFGVYFISLRNNIERELQSGSL